MRRSFSFVVFSVSVALLGSGAPTWAQTKTTPPSTTPPSTTTPSTTGKTTTTTTTTTAGKSTTTTTTTKTTTTSGTPLRTNVLSSTSGLSTTSPVNFVASRFPAALSNPGINPFPFSSGAWGPQYPSPWGPPSPYWGYQRPTWGMAASPWGGWGWNPMYAPPAPWMAGWGMMPGGVYGAGFGFGGQFGGFGGQFAGMGGMNPFGSPFASPFGYAPGPNYSPFAQPALLNLALGGMNQ